MDVFDLRNRLVSDYRSYTRSFIKIRDARIEAFVDGILGAGASGRSRSSSSTRRSGPAARSMNWSSWEYSTGNARKSSGSTSPTPTTAASSSSCISTSARRFEAIRRTSCSRTT